MAKHGRKTVSRGSRTSYISTTMGISLVLFMLGVVAFGLISTDLIRKGVKEDFAMDVFFFERANETDMHRLEKDLLSRDYIRSVKFITSSEAFEMIKGDIGVDDPLAPLGGDIPINPSLEIHLKEAWVHPDSTAIIRNQIETSHPDIVQEVFYDERMLESTNKALDRFLYYILGIAAILMFIAVAMINNTIRLSVYSKRFLIKTMTLVGARPAFIRRPFMLSAVVQGSIAGLIAISMHMGLALLAIRYAADVIEFEFLDLRVILILFGGIVALGIIIACLSTFFALRKYLRIKMDNLY